MNLRELCCQEQEALTLENESGPAAEVVVVPAPLAFGVAADLSLLLPACPSLEALAADDEKARERPSSKRGSARRLARPPSSRSWPRAVKTTATRSRCAMPARSSSAGLAEERRNEAKEINGSNQICFKTPARSSCSRRRWE